VRDCSWVPQVFENIRLGGFKCTSDRTDNLKNFGYNCIAWAAGKQDSWWWPDGDPTSFWPIPLDKTDPESLFQFIKAFEQEGYVTCENEEFENGFEKVAFFFLNGEVTHAARMLPSGAWTSKLGKGEDIEHTTLGEIEGKAYGSAKAFMKRPI